MTHTIRAEALKRLLQQRIVILDVPMGTMIQTFKLDEAGYRGQFTNYPRALKGNNDLLNLTNPYFFKSNGDHRHLPSFHTRRSTAPAPRRLREHANPGA